MDTVSDLQTVGAAEGLKSFLNLAMILSFDPNDHQGKPYLVVCHEGEYLNLVCLCSEDDAKSIIVKKADELYCIGIIQPEKLNPAIYPGLTRALSRFS